MTNTTFAEDKTLKAADEISSVTSALIAIISRFDDALTTANNRIEELELELRNAEELIAELRQYNGG